MLLGKCFFPVGWQHFGETWRVCHFRSLVELLEEYIAKHLPVFLDELLPVLSKPSVSTLPGGFKTVRQRAMKRGCISPAGVECFELVVEHGNIRRSFGTGQGVEFGDEFLALALMGTLFGLMSLSLGVTLGKDGIGGCFESFPLRGFFFVRQGRVRAGLRLLSPGILQFTHPVEAVLLWRLDQGARRLDEGRASTAHFLSGCIQRVFESCQGLCQPLV